jgi:CRP-like cAMP-binding protein
VQRIYFTGAQGDAHTVAFAYPPDYSGIPDSFFLRTPSAYTLEATTDGQVLAVHYDEFAALMSQHRELDQWAWRLFAAAAAGRAKREREHTALSAEERYERLLRESPHLLQLVPLKQIASYLGMSPETLSRIRAAS